MLQEMEKSCLINLNVVHGSPSCLFDLYKHVVTVMLTPLALGKIYTFILQLLPPPHVFRLFKNTTSQLQSSALLWNGKSHMTFVITMGLIYGSCMVRL